MASNSLYTATSPYYITDVVNGKFLDFMVNRPIPPVSTDIYYTLTPVYNYRPDLLAYDLYDDPKLWWVFAARNPNRLKDPLFDFATGLSIYIPKADYLKQVLGF